MVNIGRPRRGCSTCAKRKVKCDETKPSCIRCVKAGWECPGYAAGVDLIFRNQLSLHQNRPPGADLTREPSRGVVLTRPKCPSPLSPPLDDRAISFFAYHYVLGSNSRVPPLGIVEHLPELLWTDKIGLLRCTIIASGLAALAKAGNSDDWQITAYQKYGQALNLLRDSLNDSHLAIQEHTLASILFLGTFETITVADTQAMSSFSKHIIAAAHCIDLRGPAQFHNPISISLFLELRRLIVMTVHQLQEPMPFCLGKWSSWLAPNSIEKQPANNFAEINGRLASARFRIKSEQISASCEIAALLLPIDRELEHWACSLPVSWMYRSRKSSSATGSCDYDVYPDIWVASTWNNYRSVRIMIHQHMLSATSCCFSEDEANWHQTAICVLRDMAVGVCRSVEYYIGDLDDIRAKGNRPGMAACYQLIWPLFLSGMLRTTSLITKTWISAKLHEIGTAMGLQLAISMSEKVSISNASFSDREAWIIGEWYPSRHP